MKEQSESYAFGNAVYLTIVLDCNQSTAHTQLVVCKLQCTTKVVTNGNRLT